MYRRKLHCDVGRQGRCSQEEDTCKNMVSVHSATLMIMSPRLQEVSIAAINTKHTNWRHTMHRPCCYLQLFSIQLLSCKCVNSGIQCQPPCSFLLLCQSGLLLPSIPLTPQSVAQILRALLLTAALPVLA